MTFQIEEQLSESGTTSVYRAFDPRLHRRVLLKVLKKHFAHDADLRDRFTREARACAALRSEHIVRIFDLTEFDGSPAIAMEYVEGKSIREVIAGGDDRSVAFARRIAADVLEALSAAHAKGIIHRDIKPGNILLGPDGTVKVTDFGLATLAQTSTLTREGMVLGTPAYMSPEQIRGEKVDERSDLFSLGATLIEVTTGTRIFEGETYGECVNKVMGWKVEELDTILAGAPADWISFVKRLMNPRAGERFASAAEAYRTLVGDSPKPSVDERKNRAPRYLLMFAGILVLAAIGIFSLSVNKPNVSGSPDIERKPGADSSVSALRSHADQRGDEKTEKPEHISPAPKLGAAGTRQAGAGPADSGSVRLSAIPWAKVYIDDQLIGESPIAQALQLPAGSHTVVFSHPSFDPIIEKIDVKANKTSLVTGNFLELAGYLHCNVSPWGDVIVDDQYRDTTPMSKPIPLSAGSHRVRFHNPGFADIAQTVTIVRHDTASVSVTFNHPAR
ncbi:MAG TPA: serine/threonine-protein kinase [Bacteroidota bacterium]|nr:serine/threonine-protein kinase [Bacteroidota bacterium]